MTRTTNPETENQNPAITAARDRRGGRHHSRGVLRLVAARLAGQRHRHRVARRRHAEPAAAARLRDRARGSVFRHGRLRDLDRDRGIRARQSPGLHRAVAQRRRAGAARHRYVPGARPQSRNPCVAGARCDCRAGIRDSARSGTAGGHQAGRDFRPAEHQHATACAASCSARADLRCSPCGRSSTARAPASRKAGSHSRARSRRRSWSAWAASRRGRSPAFRWRTWIAPAYPTKCATGCTSRR